jgi:hypothetical protein
MVLALVVGCPGLAAAGAVLLPGYQNLALALHFLLPVGLSLLGSQLLEASIQTLRFSKPPAFTHRLRLGISGADLVAQGAAIALGGVNALVIVVAVIGPVKTLSSVSISVRLVTRVTILSLFRAE